MCVGILTSSITRKNNKNSVVTHSCVMKNCLLLPAVRTRIALVQAVAWDACVSAFARELIHKILGETSLVVVDGKQVSL